MTTITEPDTTTAGHPIQRIAGRTVLENPFLRVDTDDVVFPNGAPGAYSVVTSGTGLGVIAVPFVNFRGIAYLGLVRQYRYPMKDYTLEFPRGGSDNLSLAEAARELVEETGLQATSATPLGIIWPDTGILSTQVSVWKTTHASNGLRPEHVEDETGAHVLWYTHGEIIGMIRRGWIRCGMTLASLALIEGMGALSCPQ
ncbi:MAG TPA: NUDIX hydrolase [Arthrobacter sp.]